MSNFSTPLLFLIHCWVLSFTVVSPYQTPTSLTQVAVVLLVDNSGSMETNDPDGVRFTAARLFSALLDEGDQIGVVAFASQAVPLTPGLVTICTQKSECPNDSASKEDLLEWLYPFPEDGYTDVKAAFELAATMLTKTAQDTKKVVVLLTDGKPEILHPYLSYEAEALAAARRLNVPVISIALTPEAQTPFLGEVAAETGGQVIPVADAAALLDAYLQLLGQVKDRTVLYPDETQTLWIDPALSPFVQTISFIAFSKDSQQPRLVGPGEIKVAPNDPQVIFALNDTFGTTVLTMETPPGGMWHFLLGNPAEKIVVRAIVTSRLRIHAQLPALVYPIGEGIRVRVSLWEENPDGEHIHVIGDTSFSALITPPDGTQEKIIRFYDDGTHGDNIKGDGEYTYLYTPEQQGSYRLEIQAWKGIVPIQEVVNFQAINFPRLEVISPVEGLYQIREAPLSLSVRFVGDDSTHLYPGTVMAQVTSPSGLSGQVPLVNSKGDFVGTWMPQENGLYQIQFSAPEANYLGMAFTPSATLSFEVHLIPQIHIANDPIAFGVVETNVLPAGLAFSLTVTSTAQTTSVVDVILENMAGLHLQPEELLIPPGVSTLSLLITSQTILPPQKLAGQIRFSNAQETETEILQDVVPLGIEIFQPTITLTDQAINPLFKTACPDWILEVPVSLYLTGEQEEWAFASLAEDDEYRLETKSFQVSPGKNFWILSLTPTDVFRTIPQTLEIKFSSREGLAWSPVQVLFVHIQPPSLWVRCKVPFQRGLSGLVAVGIGLVWAGLRIRSAVLPAFVTGTLRHWPVGKPGLAEEIDLTSLRRTEIRLGRDPTCEIAISDPQLAKVHAILRIYPPQHQKTATPTEDQKMATWMLEPVSVVRAGYRPLNGLTPVYSETMLTMGERVYQFFADQ